MPKPATLCGSFQLFKSVVKVPNPLSRPTQSPPAQAGGRIFEFGIPLICRLRFENAHVNRQAVSSVTSFEWVLINADVAGSSCLVWHMFLLMMPFGIVPIPDKMELSSLQLSFFTSTFLHPSLFFPLRLPASGCLLSFQDIFQTI